MKHFLNDIEVAPRNVLEFGLTSNFGGDPTILQIDADKIILPREGLKIIQDWIASQGLFEGIPYRIEMGNQISLEYYVDLTESAIIRDYEIEVKIKKRGAYDNFFDNANGTSFELMAEKGVNFPMVQIPYLIVKDDVLMSGLTIAISLLVAVIKLAQQMFELLFPKVRYYKGATVKNLIQAGCTYLGYTLNSTLLNQLSNLTIMPVPLIKEKKSVVDYIENDLNFAFTKGYPTAMDSTPTLGSLIDAIETTYNAHTRVFNGEVQIERRDFWNGNTPNNILPALNMQDDMQGEFEFNTDAIWKRYYIHYEIDYADFHTVDFFDPTDAEYNTEGLNVINQDLVCIKGLNDVKLGAKGLYNNYHYINQIQLNGYKIINDAPVRMRTADFVNLLYNNFAEINGTNCEIIKIRFNNETSQAIISYKIPFDYATGKVLTTVIND